jgi:hypothetical protein
MPPIDWKNIKYAKANFGVMGLEQRKNVKGLLGAL